MTDAEHHEALGRLYAQLDHEQRQHHRSINLLRQVVAGDMPLERVEMTDSGWLILPDPEAQDVPILHGITTEDIVEAAAGAAEAD